MPFKNKHPLYHVWTSLRQRCRNPKSPGYPDYGGRGIDVCARWDSFTAFLEDMGPRPDGCSIDRIDNDKGYSPENCRWAKPKAQTRNQRRTRIVFIDGQSFVAADLADLSGLSTDTIVKRAAEGLPYAEVIDPAHRFHAPSKIASTAKGRIASAEARKARETCKNGHVWDDANTYHARAGWRMCKACNRERMAARRASLRNLPS